MPSSEAHTEIKRILSLILVLCLTASSAYCGDFSWTKNWSASDDGSIFGGEDIEDIQKDVASQVVTKTGTNVYTGINDFSAATLIGVSGSGGVTPPATNTDSYVPQWDGADSATLKDGLGVGTAADNLVQLDGTGKLPAVDGSQLTGLSFLKLDQSTPQTVTDGYTHNISTNSYTIRRTAAFPAVWRWNGGAWLDYTVEAATTRGTAWTPLSQSEAGPVTKWLYIGHSEPFSSVAWDLSAVGVGVTLSFFYWNGSTWSALAVTDGTSNFTTNGAMTFTPPVDWVSVPFTNTPDFPHPQDPVDQTSRYWIRMTSTTQETGTTTAFVCVPWDSTSALKIFGNNGDTNPSIGLDYRGYALLDNVKSTTGTIGLYSLLGIWSGATVSDNTSFKIGGGDDNRLFWTTTGNDNLQLGLVCNTAADSGYFNIMEYADVSAANRSPLANSVDPVLRIYSSDATNATDYMEFYHDQTDANIGVGGGSLKLFQNETIGDTTDGQSLYVYRKAAEGTDYFRMYVDQYRAAMLDSNSMIRIAPSASSNVSFFENGNANRTLNQYGYITAATARKYITWQVSDTTDCFELARQDTNILGFKVTLPFILSNAATSAGSIQINEDTDDGSNYASFTVPALAANTTYTLPADDGDAGEQLTTDGSGTLSWDAAGSGSGKSLGEYTTSYSVGSVYTTTTDVFLMVNVGRVGSEIGDNSKITIYSDDSNPPTTVVCVARQNTPYSGSLFAMFPIKSGKKWKVTIDDKGSSTAYIYTVPLS